VQILLGGVTYSSASGTTGTTGQVAFQITNAPSGCYSTTITSLTAAGGTWDEESLANGHCK
jgi:hypothetical protein